MGKSNDAAEKIGAYVRDYVKQNKAARLIDRHLGDAGIGLRPVIDHITFRTLNVDTRSKEFLALGFVWDDQLGRKGIIEYKDWWAKVFRKPGYPALFIDQGFDGARGNTSLIPAWVKKFGDRTLHHMAVLVDDIEASVKTLEKAGIAFAGDVVGERGSDLRQIFSKAEVKDGTAFSVLELTERHNGYAGFLPPQADGLMKSSVEKAYDQAP